MSKIRLKDIDTRAPKGVNKEETKKALNAILGELDDLQNLLYAEGKHSLLVILQGMDASGKDGLTNDVFTSMNPQGVSVHSFKVPTEEELAHDFLWRIHKHTPAKGMVQLFNRSHYEDILVTRAHGLIDDNMTRQRMEAINDFEQLLTRNNTHILKFYLHISQKEQHERLQERLDNPKKMWKYNAGDIKESKLWNEYMGYYEDIFAHCNEVPWHIVPADQNWYKSYTVAKVVLDTLKGLKMKYPQRKD